MYYYYDWTYVFILLGVLISFITSIVLKATFSKYSKLGTIKGLTAEQAAAQILQNAGINDVSISRVRGNLTDHYSPSEKVLRLSDSVYGHSSIAAIGVAAHECGHAIQHHEKYAPLGMRSMAVPLARFGSTGSYIAVVAGLILDKIQLLEFGIFLFLFVVFFQLITLPVEFNASKRAIKTLDSMMILQGDEVRGARKVLKAAAMTYVAAMISTLLQLLRLILISQRRRK